MKCKKAGFACLSAAALMALCACGGSAAEGLVVCIASEPASIDPALNSSVDGATLICHLNSGLYRYVQNDDKSGLELVPDLAASVVKATGVQVVDHVYNDATETWDAQTYSDGVRYTVTLKDNLKWSNGDSLTADDFIWSWNRASGSKLAADYCYMFEPIADGVYHETNEDACPSLGIAKVSDKVFTVDLPVDITYFDQLLAFPTFFPVHKNTVETYGDAWATEAKTYVSCGAYTLSSWTHNSNIVLKKRADYWNNKEITATTITFALSDDDSAMLASYQAGDYKMIDSVPNDQIDALKEQYGDEFVVAGQMGTYYTCFNVNSTVFTGKTEEQKAKIRRALGLLIDRKYIVDNIGKAGQICANAFVSAGLSDPAGGEFVDHNGPEQDGSGYYKKGETTAEYNANVAEAIQLLKDCGYTYDQTTRKFTDFPTVPYLFNTGSGHQAIGENLKDTFDQYGIPVSLDNQEWNQFLTTRKEGAYTFARNGWLADYDDPSSYLTMWTTNSGNNDCQFGKGAHATYAGYSADINRDGTKETGLTWAQSYDKLIDLSNKEGDTNKRFKILHEAEDLLMETGAICPIYYYTDIYMIKSDVHGFFSSPLGYKYFMYCTRNF